MDVRGFEYYAATGLPVVGATVEVWNRVAGTPVGSPIASTTTDSNGMWAFASLVDLVGKDVKVTLGGRVHWYKGETRHSMSRLLLEEGLVAPGVGNNLLVDPGFEVWDSGDGPFTASGGFVTGRWRADAGSGSSFSITRDTANFYISSLNAAVIAHAFGSGASAFYQSPENLRYMARSSYLAFGIWVKCSVASAVRAFLDGDTSAGRLYSGYHSGSGGYEQLAVVTANPLDGNTLVSVGIVLEKSGTFYADDAVLSFGTVPILYGPTPWGDEVARVERYHERQAGFMEVSGYASAAGETLYRSFPWRVRKALVPTVTLSGSWTLQNANTPTVDAATVDGYRLAIVSTAAGQVGAFGGLATVNAVAQP
jgi:hypothetical protein